MRIILAQPRGFCSGVKRAVQMLESALEHSDGQTVCVYHHIVHNTWIVEDFQRRGVVFVESLDEVPDGASMLFSAHGVAPHIRHEADARNIKTIDATCLLVEKIHQAASHYADAGYKIVLIGHRKHDEIVGIAGEAPDVIFVVETESEIAALDFAAHEKLAYLTQTTLSLSETQTLIECLKQRFPQIEGPFKTNICSATQSRQDAIRKAAKDADAVLIVGSRNSCNSRRLQEVAEAEGLPAYLVDGPNDMHPGLFNSDSTILVTAGASAPEHLVEGCIELLKGIPK